MILKAAIKYHGKEEIVPVLARFICHYGYEGQTFHNKKDAAVLALELLEEMTGTYWDPTQEEFDDILYSIY